MKGKEQFYVVKEKAVPEVLLKVVEAKKLLETGTTEEAVQILKEAGCLKETMEKVTEKIAFYMNYHIEGRVQTEAIVFSSNEGLLGETPGAGELLERLREQEEKENRKE